MPEPGLLPGDAGPRDRPAAPRGGGGADAAERAAVHPLPAHRAGTPTVSTSRERLPRIDFAYDNPLRPEQHPRHREPGRPDAAAANPADGGHAPPESAAVRERLVSLNPGRLAAGRLTRGGRGGRSRRSVGGPAAGPAGERRGRGREVAAGVGGALRRPGAGGAEARRRGPAGGGSREARVHRPPARPRRRGGRRGRAPRRPARALAPLREGDRAGPAGRAPAAPPVPVLPELPRQHLVVYRRAAAGVRTRRARVGRRRRRRGRPAAAAWSRGKGVASPGFRCGRARRWCTRRWTWSTTRRSSRCASGRTCSPCSCGSGPTRCGRTRPRAGRPSTTTWAPAPRRPGRRRATG